MINCRWIPKQMEKLFKFFLKDEKQSNSQGHAKILQTPNAPYENFTRAKNSQTNFALQNSMRNLKTLSKLVSKTSFALWKHCKIWKRLQTQFVTQKPILQPCEFQRSLCWIPTVSGKPKGHLKSLFKDLQSRSFRTTHSPLWKPFTTLQISFLSNGRPVANHLKRRPTLLTPLPWHTSEEAIPTL